MAERLAILGRCLFLVHYLPNGLPIQATEGVFLDKDLPPQYQCERQHLLGHS